LRVYISGIGMISPLGETADANWDKLLAGESNIHPIPERWKSFMEFSSLYYSPLALPDFLTHGFKRSELIQRDPVSNLAILTAHEALRSAGLELNQTNKKSNQFEINGIDSLRAGVIYGTGWGGGNSILSNHSHHLVNAVKQQLETAQKPLTKVEQELDKLPLPRRYNPFVVSMLICNSVPASIAMKFSLHGQVRPVVHACASGTTAIGRAAEAIRNGDMDMVITGGAEYLNDAAGASHYCFDAARTLVDTPAGCDPEKINRPFDQDRSGFLFSEGGAATLIIENERSIEKRGVQPLAEIVGFAETFDAYSIMAPDPSGVQIERMMSLALKDAGLKPDDIDYLNAHGTGTEANDVAEAEVIGRTLGENCLVNSSKSILGHTIGASGAIEAIVGVLSLQHQELHPSLNLDNPVANLNFVRQRQTAKIEHVMSHSFAFGGHNSGVIFAKV